MFADRDDFRVKKTIGSSWNVDEEDVVKTKTALKKTGDYKMPEWGVTGYPDQNMFDGLKSFQKREGLQVDGVMKPGGPTEKRLAQKMKPPSAAGTVAGSKQPGKTNARGFVEGEWDWRRIGTKPGPVETGGFAGLTDWPGIKTTSGPLLPLDDLTEIGNELPGGRKRGPDRKKKRPGEKEVALAPLIPVIAAGGAALMRNSPQILRGLQGIFRTAPLIGAAEEARKQVERSGRSRSEYPSPIPQPPKDEDRTKDRSDRVAIDPPPPTPGFEPPDENLPDRTESPAEPVELPTLEGRPVPDQGKPVIETFPVEDSLVQGIFLENSRGDPETDAKNRISVALVIKAFKAKGYKVRHINGSYNERDEYLKERYLAPVDELGLPASKMDFSIEVEDEHGHKTIIDANTFSHLFDVNAPKKDERVQSYKARTNHDWRREKLGEDAQLLMISKLRGTPVSDYEKIIEPTIVEGVRNIIAKIRP